MEQVLYKLPDGWEWMQLGEALDVRDGTHDSPKYVERGFPLVTSKNITGKGLDVQNVKYISQEDFDAINKRSKVDVGDMLFAMIGTIGFPTVVTDEPSYAIKNVALFKKRQDDQNMDFFKYFLESPYAIESMLAQAKGAAQKFVGLRVLRSFNIPLPPKVEQKRIVEKLDALLTRIDTAIEYLQGCVQLADALYASALDKNFSKLMKESDVIPFKKLVDNQDGRRVPIKAGERKNTHGSYPYYGATGVIDYVDDFIFEGERLLISEDGANLVARKYPIAFIADGKYWVNNHAHVVNALPELTSNLYLKKFFAWVDLSSYITGSAQPKLSQGKLNTIPVPVPPLSKQTEIVAELDKAHQLTENLKIEVGEKLGILTSLKASILDSAFKGEL